MSEPETTPDGAGAEAAPATPVPVAGAPSSLASEPAPVRRRRPLKEAFVMNSMAFLVAVAAGSLGMWAAIFASYRSVGGWILGLGAFVAALVYLIKTRRYTRVAFEVLVLGGLVAWGLILNRSLSESCVADACGVDQFRYLAEPYVFELLCLHALTVLAYAISRRRPEALPPPVEALVHAALVTGVVLQALVAVQFGGALFVGLLLPLAMPALAPLFTIVLYARELVTRLRRRGAEQSTIMLPASSAYRSPIELRIPSPWPHVPRPMLWRAIATSPLLLGTYGIATALVSREWTAAARVFTQTCGHALSQVPIQPAVGECHYLCTVAAQGHAGLVRPERFGRRRGQVIVVNRQLAVANAFEDLLHTRWPRFGGLARRVYDRVGLPVSRWLQWRWAADLVYVAMKPAEWLFYVALLLLNPASPEARIDRMYR